MEHNEESFDGTECYCDKSEREAARELRIQEEINAQSYFLANGGENDEPGAFVLDPEYPVFRPPCPEMSPDDPVCEEPLIEPPIRGWELYPPNITFGLPGKITCTVGKTYSVACSVLAPHFEEIGTSLMVGKEKLRIECVIKHPAVNGPSQAYNRFIYEHENEDEHTWWGTYPYDQFTSYAYRFNALRKNLYNIDCPGYLSEYSPDNNITRIIPDPIWVYYERADLLKKSYPYCVLLAFNGDVP
jgi:hypothetical protein